MPMHARVGCKRMALQRQQCLYELMARAARVTCDVQHAGNTPLVDAAVLPRTYLVASFSCAALATRTSSVDRRVAHETAAYYTSVCVLARMPSTRHGSCLPLEQDTHGDWHVCRATNSDYARQCSCQLQQHLPAAVACTARAVVALPLAPARIFPAPATWTAPAKRRAE